MSEYDRRDDIEPGDTGATGRAPRPSLPPSDKEFDELDSSFADPIGGPPEKPAFFEEDDAFDDVFAPEPASISSTVGAAKAGRANPQRTTAAANRREGITHSWGPQGPTASIYTMARTLRDPVSFPRQTLTVGGRRPASG